MRQVSKIIIVNHWKRKAEGLVFKKLLEANAKQLGVDVELSYDDGSLDIWGNYKQALNIPARESERFRLIIQDDMTLARNALEKIFHIMRYLPDECFASFYGPNNKQYRDFDGGPHRIMRTHTNFSTPLFAFGTKIIKPFLDWADNPDNVRPEIRYEDSRIRGFSMITDIPIYCHQPSLGQHLGAFRSTMGFAGLIGGRNKRWTDHFDPDADVMNIDWEKEIEEPLEKEYSWDLNYLHKDTLKND